MKRIGLLCVFFVCFSSIFLLFPQRVTAIGDTTIIQINGAAQTPGFTPALLTLHVYDTVVFVNRATTSYALVADDGSFSSSIIPVGQQWRVTFSSTGTHEYHTAESPQHMVGEILVVANTVALLPTPVPQIEATTIALIKAGKHPPDVPVLPVTPTPTTTHKATVQKPNVLFSPPVLFTGGGVLLLLAVLLLMISLWRRHRKRIDEEEEMETSLEEMVAGSTSQKSQIEVPPAKKQHPMLASLRWRRSDGDDDDGDDDDE